MTMESDIYDWIICSLSVELEEFNGLPACPFAKQAMIENKVKVVHLTNIFDHITMSEYFTAELENFTYHWPKNIDVVVLGCDPKKINADSLSKLVETANETFLKERGYIALEDHPDVIESVAGYTVNQGTWALILLQSYKKIIGARKILEKRGYYKNWDQDYYKEVVLDRS